MIIVWFFGVVFGSAAVLVQLLNGSYYSGLDSLLAYIGAPMGGGIVSYMIKSAFENKQKIISSQNLPYACGTSGNDEQAGCEDNMKNDSSVTESESEMNNYGFDTFI